MSAQEGSLPVVNVAVKLHYRDSHAAVLAVMDEFEAHMIASPDVTHLTFKTCHSTAHARLLMERVKRVLPFCYARDLFIGRDVDMDSIALEHLREALCQATPPCRITTLSIPIRTEAHLIPICDMLTDSSCSLTSVTLEFPPLWVSGGGEEFHGWQKLGSVIGNNITLQELYLYNVPNAALKTIEPYIDCNTTVLKSNVFPIAILERNVALAQRRRDACRATTLAILALNPAIERNLTRALARLLWETRRHKIWERENARK